MNISQLLSWTQNQLRFSADDSSADDSSVEAEILLRHALQIDRVTLYSSLDASASKAAFQSLGSLLQRRLSGEPISYITGYREFYGMELEVTPAVLIPRQETESLVEKAIEFLENRTPTDMTTIVDVGTGSGAIAIAISSHLPLAKIYATDNSSSALSVANTNRKKAQMSQKVQLVQCDLLRGLNARFDMIISNLPYIPTIDIPKLPREVQAEPVQALDGGSNGLALIGRLIKQAPQYLKSRGRLFIEISPQQVSYVLTMAHDSMPGCTVEVIKDLYGNSRIVSIKQSF